MDEIGGEEHLKQKHMGKPTADIENSCPEKADLDQELIETEKENHEEENPEKDLLIRNGRLGILELINENEVTLNSATSFLHNLLEQTQGTAPDHAQFFLKEILEEQKTNSDQEDDLIEAMPMGEDDATKKWIKEYKEKNPMTILSDEDLDHLANGESIFLEMTHDQMQQYNAEQDLRLEMYLFLCNGFVNGLLMAVGCLMVGTTLDYLFR
ncbi:uncharacterized protein LOC117903467 [Drosophila subobscura]|uniref:uncharacterized protein LOC117903467 n=1 Tax=Drosophila subobscura TaxID=7241 RepID=UPI00155A832C|nr:uncharacterized protein LOC117903467 [Drosophila subobscura]